MAIYKSGKKIDLIYKNGKKEDTIYKNGVKIYSSFKIPEIKPFANATENEIAQYLDLHYKGLIDISNYWNVGDTRKMHLDAISSSGNAQESHVAQDITMVIIGFKHDTLKQTINGQTKAAITLQCRECLGNNGKAEYGYYWGFFRKASLDSNYSQSSRRIWLNENFINALPTNIKPLIKTVIKKNIADHSSKPGAGPDTEDKAFLTSYPEMFGSYSNAAYGGSPELEGEQYLYYTSDIRIKKYINNNGVASQSAYSYFLRSPSKMTIGDNYCWAIVSERGIPGYTLGSSDSSFAPAFCL